MQHIPRQTVSAWIEQKRKLDPRRLIPALVHYHQQGKSTQVSRASTSNGNECLHLDLCGIFCIDVPGTWTRPKQFSIAKTQLILKLAQTCSWRILDWTAPPVNTFRCTECSALTSSVVTYQILALTEGWRSKHKIFESLNSRQFTFQISW